jgi:hypothetical protein
VLSLTLSVADAGALRALFDHQLSQGRAFLPGASEVDALTPCELVIACGGREHRLAAEVVFVKGDDPGQGVGLQLAPMDPDARDALRSFVDASSEAAAGPPGGDDGEVDAGEPGPATGPGPRSERPTAEAERLALNVQERIRSLSNVEQQRLAAAGTLSERIVLERMYGANVWETLLRNSRLTIPEVARIGRKGTVPRPLVDLIAANPSWLAASEVQRALLSNPRCSPTVIEKVLRALSRNDLQLAPQQTAYPAAVRQAAKRLLGR